MGTRLLTKLLLFSIFSSCNNPEILGIYIPHNYEGNIYLVFDKNQKSSEKLNRKGAVEFTFVDNPPVKFISDNYDNSFADLNLSIIDKETGKDIDRSELDFEYRRSFDTGIDTFVLDQHMFIYLHALITQNFYKKTDSNLVRLKNKYSYQLDDLKLKLLNKK